ncbi:hypothetical protein PoB_003992900 [Plakobranchus ocellatus]|uniref:Uncharacterized protein n=1 Tax=Plakobranchus ocellatus TaxID=259542 RepID=A0AAV4B4W2_9GAST|nr:hypothetical protein PoB_003992900 [Plakobranchus ocellatus]
MKKRYREICDELSHFHNLHLHKSDFCCDTCDRFTESNMRTPASGQTSRTKPIPMHKPSPSTASSSRAPSRSNVGVGPKKMLEYLNRGCGAHLVGQLVPEVRIPVQAKSIFRLLFCVHPALNG